MQPQRSEGIDEKRGDGGGGRAQCVGFAKDRTAAIADSPAALAATRAVHARRRHRRRGHFIPAHGLIAAAPPAVSNVRRETLHSPCAAACSAAPSLHHEPRDTALLGDTEHPHVRPANGQSSEG